MSLRQPDLERQAREFAGKLSDLLNGTVTHGVRLRSYMERNGRAVVGYMVSEANAVGDCVPLTISQSPARLYLSVLHTLELDDSETFLTTSKSTYTLQEDDDTGAILTYDFVRDPPNEFPEAHIHVHGESDVLSRLLLAGGRDKRANQPPDPELKVADHRYLRFRALRVSGWSEGGEQCADSPRTPPRTPTPHYRHTPHHPTPPSPAHATALPSSRLGEVYDWCMARTNIDIDDEACEQIMRQHRLRTKREAVNLALRSLAVAPVAAGDALAVPTTGRDGDNGPERASRLEQLQSSAQMDADEIIDLGIDLVERQLADRCRDRAEALLSSDFVGCLPDAPSDLAVNHRQYLAESFGEQRDAG